MAKYFLLLQTTTQIRQHFIKRKLHSLKYKSFLTTEEICVSLLYNHTCYILFYSYTKPIHFPSQDLSSLLLKWLYRCKTFLLECCFFTFFCLLFYFKSVQDK